jgi:hypothetical protein
MSVLASQELAARTVTMAAVQTEAQARARQQHVRDLLLRLIGGLPQNSGPLNPQVVGTIEQKGFRIEKIIYDSLPGYHVTANLYLPASGSGPFPAVIYSAGHGPFGKSEAYGMGANLARNGIAMLAYDPLGAGERIQALDPATGKSYAGGDEHSQAQIPISLVGDSVARYMVWDAMRGIDYLSTRPEIVKDHIGSYGCSGGGTMSAYLTALDTRVNAGVVACFLTTYDALMPSIGPQDGEQVIPNFIKNGLDFADLVELAAPRAYAQVSTTEDMFPFKGAQATHDEAARFYGLLHAGNKLQFFTGPGGHGAIRPLNPKILGFFMHELAGNDATPVVENFGFRAPVDLTDTKTGQVTTSLQGRTIYEINRERAETLMPKPMTVSTVAQLRALQEKLRKEIPVITSMQPRLQQAPAVVVTSTFKRSPPSIDIALQRISFPSRSGITLPGLSFKTKSAHARLIFTSDALDTADPPQSPIPAIREAMAKGETLLMLNPLPWPPSNDENKVTFGTTLPMTSRALLVGKTFVGMRADDVLAAVQYLASLGATSVDAEADGPVGVALLHAAVLEPRIASITLHGSLSSYKSVLTAMPHRMVTETVVPGVLLHYDLDDLLVAMGPRPVTLIAPVDGGNQPLTGDASDKAFARVRAARTALHENSDGFKVLRSASGS